MPLGRGFSSRSTSKQWPLNWECERWRSVASTGFLSAIEASLWGSTQVVVELKTVRRFENVHFAVVRSYLKSLGLRHGLLLNFSAVTLEIKRVIAP